MDISEARLKALEMFVAQRNCLPCGSAEWEHVDAIALWLLGGLNPVRDAIRRADKVAASKAEGARAN